MYNTDIPSRAELPTSRQLLRSTIIAIISAIVLLFTVVLPADYGIDPTGVGRILGLTEMGEIKARLAQEAAADEAAMAQAQAAEAAGTAAPTVAAPVVAPPVAAAPAQDQAPAAQTSAWRDEASYVLKPGEGIEIKMRMNAGDTARFSWSVQGGVVNFDTHGDAPGQSISYEKGRAVAADEGELKAAFTGSHGWFFRNRGKSDVTVTLRTGGEYQDIRRAM